MTVALERNCREFGIELFAPGAQGAENQGIVHVIGPQLGLTQPGMTIACGDSHTSTHGALGAIAFGIGTSQVRDVLASQCLALDPLKVRRIEVNGQLRLGRVRERRDSHDHPPARRARRRRLSPTNTAARRIDRMSIDERMTICNMSIEGGARVGYVNPDETTFAYLKGRRFAPQGEAFDRAVAWWRKLASDADADVRRPRGDRRRDDRADGHLGHQPGAVGWHRREHRRERGRGSARRSWASRRGAPVRGTRIDVAFIGSCTNGRALGPRGGGENRQGTARGASRQGARRPRQPRRPSGRRSQRARRDFHQGRLRVARRRVLDVPGHEHRSAAKGDRCARRRRTAISRAAWAAPPAARCS